MASNSALIVLAECPQAGLTGPAEDSYGRKAGSELCV